MYQEKTASKQQYWYVLYTKSRHEFKVNHLLRDKNFNTYLPLKEEFRQWHDRIKQISSPLFPGYLFINCTMNKYEYYEILNCRGIVSVVGNKWPNFSTISENKIKSIRIALNNKLTVNVLNGIQKNDLIRIRSGPLKGIEGRLKRKNEKKFLLYIELETLNQSIEVQINCRNILIENI